MTDAVKALRALYDACHWVPSNPDAMPLLNQVALWDQAKAALAASKKNTGWRDIKADPPKETREGILCYEPPIAGPYPSPARRYVSSGYALKHQYLCGTEDENPTHWQPLPPPPGKEVEDWYALGVKDGRDGCLVELDALQARCAELEAAARDALRLLQIVDQGGGWNCDDDERAAVAVAKALRDVVDGGSDDAQN